MGLDYVELFMRLEEEFEIDIPDQDAETLNTVGEIAEYVAIAIGATLDTNRLAVWERVQTIVADEISIPEARITPTSRIIEDLGMG